MFCHESNMGNYDFAKKILDLDPRPCENRARQVKTNTKETNLRFKEPDGDVPWSLTFIVKGCWIRIRTDPHSFWSAGSGSIFVVGIRIWIQEGQINDPQK